MQAPATSTVSSICTASSARSMPIRSTSRRATAAFAPLLDDDRHGVVWIVDSPPAYAVLTWGWSIEAGGAEAVLDEIFVSRTRRGRRVVADPARAGRRAPTRTRPSLPRDRDRQPPGARVLRAARIPSRRLDLDDPRVRRPVVTDRRRAADAVDPSDVRVRRARDRGRRCGTSRSGRACDARSGTCPTRGSGAPA